MEAQTVQQGGIGAHALAYTHAMLIHDHKQLTKWGQDKMKFHHIRKYGTQVIDVDTGFGQQGRRQEKED
eukprot:5252716-Heterocapsa_arctica.AAC.1